MKPLMVLAGGFGTRLTSEVTEVFDVSKSLAPEDGAPLIVYFIEHWAARG